MAILETVNRDPETEYNHSSLRLNFPIAAPIILILIVAPKPDTAV